ncbi:MAG TPA: FAD-dependent thymidylate synthase [Candidatus Bathyarchaeia archaeon]|nr:FAD-dependent thymidylate synthase [Candidatus Bathyarchaeia archaeon]
MKVTIAGFNVDSEILGETRKRFGEAVTPEVISASYARISRDPRSVASLRREARDAVEKARASNERIVFGLGHSSVAEHAVLNLDITGISRLAVEEVEHFRLASFTEKSQRYVRLGKDVVVPPEIRGIRLEKEFESLTHGLHEAYESAYRTLTGRGEEAGAAKEDARYLMPLATATQLGMTVNARELEYMIRRLAAHPLEELREFSHRAFRVSRALIPSLIRYPEPDPHDLGAREAKQEVRALVARRAGRNSSGGRGVVLVDATPDADTRLAAFVIFSSCGTSMRAAAAAAARLGKREKESIIAATVRSLEAHDAVWREFENIHFTFEIVLSASCYAQLKRHRIATLVSQPYDTGLGISVPRTFVRARAVGMIREAALRAETFYRANVGDLGPAAEYVLLNAHRRRILLTMNLRELYHFSRLRSDTSAQWEIREISDEMCRLAAEKAPSGAGLLGGKDRFVGMEGTSGLKE